MMALILVHALALHGINYTDIRCQEEWILHLACDHLNPAPLTNGEDYDTCYRHWSMCHVRMSDWLED